MGTENEEFIKKVEDAAREGAKQGSKDRERKPSKSSVTGIVLGILLVVVLVVGGVFVVRQAKQVNWIKEQFTVDQLENHDMTLENGIFGYTAVDFADVILGAGSMLKRLEVYTQELSDKATVTKAGLLKLEVFSKQRNFIYSGTATYTVDLEKLSTNSVEIDPKNKIVILYIPHPECLESGLNVPIEKVEIGDTQKGMLAFGELDLTYQDAMDITEEVKNRMKQKLEDENIQKTADRMAVLSVWEIFQPIISKLAPGASLNVKFIGE